MKKRKIAKLLKMPIRRGMPVFAVESRILLLRRQKVILDTDLAELYGVSVKRLNEQVRRNHERFPADFMFQLSAKRTTSFEVANCDLKQGPWRAALSTVCVHGTRRDHGRDRAQF
jgi:hypothetical protein